MPEAPRPIRVLLVPDSIAGETGRHAWTIARGLNAERFALTVACVPGADDEPSFAGPIAAQGVRTVTLFERAPAAGLARFQDAIALRRLLEGEGFDLIVGIGPLGGPSARMAPRRVRGPGVRLHLLHGLGPLRRAPTRWLRWSRSWRRRLTARRRHYAVFGPTAAAALAAHALADPAAITIVPWGIEPIAFDPGRIPAVRMELELPSDLPTVGVDARLDEAAGLEALMRSAERLKRRMGSFAILIGGDGPLRDRWIDEIQNRGLRQCVRLVGRRVAPEALMAATDVWCRPAPDDPTPRPLLEAMLLERPIVAVASGVARDTLDHGRTGLLAAPGDPAALADALERLLGDAALRRTLGHAAREAALAAPRFETAMRRLEALMEALVGSGERGAVSAG